MTYVIGFANKFYTLWTVQSESLYSTIHSANGEQHYKSGERTICTYIKNVSTDLNKVKELHPELEIWENLRGKTSSFEYENGYSRIEYADDVFSRGYLRGQSIAACEDVRSLQWSYDNEYSDSTKSNIEARLNELGFVNTGYNFTEKAKHEAELAVKLAAKNAIEATLLQFENGGTFNICPNKNLNSLGWIEIDGVIIVFPEFKKMYYGDFTYALPSIKGVGKKIKGNNLELKVKTQVMSLAIYGSDSEPVDVKALAVESFKICK